MTASDQDYFVCPVCGEEVPIKALACPECGADDETGWSEDAAYDEVDLPDSAFDGPERPENGLGLTRSPIYKAVLILMVILILVFILARGF